jgi:Arc/MetJ family transcription regulator
MSVTVDERLVAEVRRLFGASTKAEAIRLALEHAIRHARLEQALEHAGKLPLDVDLEELERLRSES